VIWLFDRAGQRLRYEICREDGGDGYLLVMSSDDGQKRVEHVEQPTELIERSVFQMRQLKDDGWKIG
jgi:hypothetical protein